MLLGPCFFGHSVAEQMSDVLPTEAQPRASERNHTSFSTPMIYFGHERYILPARLLEVDSSEQAIHPDIPTRGRLFHSCMRLVPMIVTCLLMLIYWRDNKKQRKSNGDERAVTRNFQI